MEKLYHKIEEVRKEGKIAALCIIIQTKGSTPRKIGAKMLVYENASISGSIGGGNLEKKVIEQALVQMKLSVPDTFKYNLVKELEMCCGGSVAVYIEPIMKINRLYIFGAGHTGEALARIALTINFDVTLLDDRAEYIENIKINNLTTTVFDFEKDLENLKIDANTYVVIMTYSHPVDRQLLSYFVDKKLAYLGMIGSERKVVVAKKMLKDGEFASVKQLQEIDMPMGLAIKANGPEEIAVSILAKLIEVKNKKLGK